MINNELNWFYTLALTEGVQPKSMDVIFVAKI